MVVVTRPHVCHKAERACSQWAFPSCRVETSCRHNEALSGGHNLRTKSTPSWGHSCRVCHKAERACSQWAFPSCLVETSGRHNEATRERNHLAGLLSGGHNLRTKSTPSWGHSCGCRSCCRTSCSCGCRCCCWYCCWCCSEGYGYCCCCSGLCCAEGYGYCCCCSGLLLWLLWWLLLPRLL